MSSTYEPQPTYPAEWLNQYALSDVVSAVPVKEDTGMKDGVGPDIHALDMVGSANDGGAAWTIGYWLSAKSVYDLC